MNGKERSGNTMLANILHKCAVELKKLKLIKKRKVKCSILV